MKILRETKSACPECLKTLSALLYEEDETVFLTKTCEEHGNFKTVIWRGTPYINDWEIKKNRQSYNECPHNCKKNKGKLCEEHGQKTCTVLFEITKACNLKCPVCFANSIDSAKPLFEKDLDKIAKQIKWIREYAGAVVLQISGGEPTLHPKLIKIIELSSALFPAVQLNTNGLILAENISLAHDLKKAGLSWVFLQFDGVTDEVHQAFRGQKLQYIKEKAIANCKKAGLSVVLVSVVAKGINDLFLGDVLRYALQNFPTVRGVHFQPMTLAGRNTLKNCEHITLPEVLTKLSEQSYAQNNKQGNTQANTMIATKHAKPSSCEHDLCSFFCRYFVNKNGTLEHIQENTGECDCDNYEQKNYAHERSIESIIRSWKGDNLDIEKAKNSPTSNANLDALDSFDAFDAFLAKAKRQTFSVTCMAFQDAYTLDTARLNSCCVHVYDGSENLIPFCAYNLTSTNGKTLYRK